MPRLLPAVIVMLAFALPAHAGSTSPAPAAGSLHLTFMNDCGANRSLVEAAEREAARVWAGHVALRWSEPSRISYTAPRSSWVVVRCIAEQPRLESRDRSAAAIATIRFVAREPTNTIVASLGNARALLDRDAPHLRDMDQRFAVFREIRLGRMLGRAIAHEIGHFLTRSVVHTPTGLMRAVHSVGALAGESLDPFRIDRAEIAGYAAADFLPPPAPSARFDAGSRLAVGR
jgi:hypothetical protein